MPDYDLVSSPPRSPCVGICRVESAGTCAGCLRTLQEIAAWPVFSDLQRQEILRRVERRKADRANGQ